MPRFAIRLEDGTPYMGWQYQEHGPSVQGAVIDAFREFTGETLTVHASGRTDAGVHALAGHSRRYRRRLRRQRIREALNGCLRPHPIAALEVIEVDDAFHARFECTGRAYRYIIVNRPGLALERTGRGWCAHRWTPTP